MKSMIIGGAGFIGSNVVHRLLKNGEDVVVVDNLSRRGSERNLEWLQSQGDFEFIKEDIRNYDALKRIFRQHKDVDVVYHEAAQVAVTTSVVNPREDFEINALGTFNVLEAIRETGISPIVLFASTNKVYGGLEHIKVVEKGTRYAYENLPNGVSENEQLDFHSPYGCSKGAADQYMRDYARLYGLRTVVFRQSCIYGYRQFGVEDQGWVAWFTIAATFDKEITIYGDGKQVRDVLFIDDLIDAYFAAIKNIDKAAGQIYNIGGGMKNQMSLLELLDFLSEFFNKKIAYTFSKWRPGDQRIYISDISKAKNELSWEPKISVGKGVKKLYEWVTANKALFQDLEL